MTAALEGLAAYIKDKLAGSITASTVTHGELTLMARRADIVRVLTLLRPRRWRRRKVRRGIWRSFSGWSMTGSR